LQTAGQFPACPKGQKIPIVLNYYTKDNGVIQGEERAKRLVFTGKTAAQKEKGPATADPFLRFHHGERKSSQ
jgi:hypothetical protein